MALYGNLERWFECLHLSQYSCVHENVRKIKFLAIDANDLHTIWLPFYDYLVYTCLDASLKLVTVVLTCFADA